MKSALLISYWMPPSSTQTWRSFHIYFELKKFFPKVNVITKKTAAKPVGKEQIELSKNLIKIPVIDYRTILYYKKENEQTTEAKKNKFTLWLYKLLNSFPLNLIFGEGGIIYIIIGYKKAKKIVEQENVDFLFSTFRPYSDHFIAYLLKARHPKIFWVADFRDLHIDPLLKETIFPRFQKWCNQKILSKADIVTIVSKGLAGHLKEVHHNVVVLRNGIGKLNRYTPVKESEYLKKFTITYTGSMFRNLRNPELFLEAISELILEGKIKRNQFVLRYAGKDTNTWHSFLKKHNLLDIFYSYGIIPHQDAINLQNKSHINLLLTYASKVLKGNATGKLYEYLAARQPILLIISGCKDDEIEEIFSKTKAGIVVYHEKKDREKIKKFIMSKYKEWETTGSVNPVVSDKHLVEFKWENMLSNFLMKHYFTKKEKVKSIV